MPPSDDLHHGTLAGSTSREWTWWHCMGLKVLFCLLTDGRWQISPAKLVILISLIPSAFVNSISRLIADRIYLNNLEQNELPDNPIFIVGHFRTGSTLLHQLMALDQHLQAPTTEKCFHPATFLLKYTKQWHKLYSSIVHSPKNSNRPQDNVKIELELPQEEEFALMFLGAATFYKYYAFPRQHNLFVPFFDFDHFLPEEKDQWNRLLCEFIKRLLLVDKRRLVLKSPLNTARIKNLSTLFPKAKFIHLSRNPYSVILSTMHTTDQLCFQNSLQCSPPLAGIENVVKYFNVLHNSYKRDRSLISPGDIVEIRYEDLISKPVDVLAFIYDSLKIDNPNICLKDLDLKLRELKAYKANHHVINAEQKEYIARHCADYFDIHGYCINTGLPL